MRTNQGPRAEGCGQQLNVELTEGVSGCPAPLQWGALSFPVRERVQQWDPVPRPRGVVCLSPGLGLPGPHLCPTAAGEPLHLIRTLATLGQASPPQQDLCYLVTSEMALSPDLATFGGTGSLESGQGRG